MMQFLKEKTMWRYLGIAVCIVAFEIALFQMLVLWGAHYFAATAISFSAAVVTNWWLSRVFVFKHSRYSLSVEIALVFAASIVGLGLQMAVVYITVEVARMLPIAGKILSIFVSFFWNYWFRARFVFNKSTPAPDTQE